MFVSYVRNIQMFRDVPVCRGDSGICQCDRISFKDFLQSSFALAFFKFSSFQKGNYKENEIIKENVNQKIFQKGHKYNGREIDKSSFFNYE